MFVPSLSPFVTITTFTISPSEMDCEIMPEAIKASSSGWGAKTTMVLAFASTTAKAKTTASSPARRTNGRAASNAHTGYTRDRLLESIASSGEMSPSSPERFIDCRRKQPKSFQLSPCGLAVRHNYSGIPDLRFPFAKKHTLSALSIQVQVAMASSRSHRVSLWPPR